MSLLVDIYRCSKKEGMYLYVVHSKDLSELPDKLLQLLGKTEITMKLLLAEDKKLANASAPKVINSIQVEGYYLQMPPLPPTSNDES